MLELRLLESGRKEICETILRSLPKWFGIESSILNYIAEVSTMPIIAAFDGDQAIGFVSLKRHSANHLEMYVMAVLPQFHRQGLGKALVCEAEKFARGKSAAYLSVKTISEASANPEYAGTRKFYLDSGFRPFEEFTTLWGKENPCLLMIKPLN